MSEAPAEASVTGNFYEDHAREYFGETVDANLQDLRASFLQLVEPGGLVLDAGSGSGRDTRAFLQAGYRVEGIDASPALAGLSSNYTGVKTQVIAFEDFPVRPGRYDGIWAMASLLHVDRSRLTSVLAVFGRSLKAHATLFASFKRGTADTIDTLGRRFTNLTIDSAHAAFTDCGEFEQIEVRAVPGTASYGHRVDWIHIFAKRDAD